MALNHRFTPEVDIYNSSSQASTIILLRCKIDTLASSHPRCGRAKLVLRMIDRLRGGDVDTVNQTLADDGEFEKQEQAMAHSTMSPRSPRMH